MLGGKLYTVDPAKRVSEALSKITTVSDLQNATLKNGTKLLAGSNASLEDLKIAAGGISQLHGAMTNLPNSQLVPEKAASGSGKTWAEEVDSKLWDAWHWVEGKFDEAKKWVITQIGDNRWQFMVELGGKVWSFLLETTTQVLKAMSMILKKIGIDVDKIIEWIGFLFDWDDILATQREIAQFTNQAITWSANSITGASQVLDSWFIDMTKKVQNLTLPENFKQMKGSQNAATAQTRGGHSEKAQLALNTPGGNWCNYQVEHGGIFSSSMTAMKASEGSNNPFEQLVKNIIEPALSVMMSSIDTLRGDLGAFFDPNSDFTIGELFQKLGSDVIVSFLGVLQKIFVGTIALAGDIIRDLQAVGNTPINIPVLTALWNGITKGSDLTLLNAVCLLIAIPVTVSSKILNIGPVVLKETFESLAGPPILSLIHI